MDRRTRREQERRERIALEKEKSDAEIKLQHIKKEVPKPIELKGQSKLWNNRLKKLWKVFLGIVAIGTFLQICHYFYETILESPRKTFVKKHITEGDVESPKISENKELENKKGEDTSRFYINEKTYTYPKIKGIYLKDLGNLPTLYFNFGTFVLGYSPEQLHNGITPFNGVVLGNCGPVNLEFIEKDDRLYVSCNFIDLDENKIGEMEFNHWKIYNDKFLDYHCNNTSFEITDFKGHVVFSISFRKNKSQPFVSIAGYLTNPDAIFVLNHETPYFCIEKSDSNWKQKAEREIYKIRPIVKSECD